MHCSMVHTPLDLKAQTVVDGRPCYGEGEFQFGIENVYMGERNISYGVHRDKTRFVNTGYRVSAQGCCWQANSGVEMHDLTMESRVVEGQQSQVFGFQGNYDPEGPQVANNAHAKLYRCRLIGRTFGLYIWGGVGNTISAYDTDIIVGQYGVSGGGGSGPDAQYIYLYNCRVVIDFQRLRGAGGDQGLNAVGLWGQGGKVVMYGGSITVKGYKDAPIARGAWLARPWEPDVDWPYPWPVMELHNVTCRVNPNGTPDWCDVCGDIGAPILVVGGTGSGPNGEWITKGNVVVQNALVQQASRSRSMVPEEKTSFKRKKKR